jgi:hypothetical protein
MCMHTSHHRDDPDYYFLRPPVLGRGYAPKRRNHHERRFFFSAGSAEDLWHPTPDLLPLRSTSAPRSTVSPVLFVPNRRRENNYLTAPLRLWAFCVAPVASPRGRARPVPPLASDFLLIYMFELPTQRERWHAKTTGAGRKAAILQPISLGWLTRGVDLLICYVDLRYGCPFEELADLSQLTDRREVAPVRPI